MENPNRAQATIARGIQPASREDKKLAAALCLRKNVARLDDAREEIACTIKDLNTLDSKHQERSIQKLQKIVLPMMETALKSDMPEALKNVEAIPGVAYVHQVNEAKENLAARQRCGRQDKQKSMALKCVENTLCEQKKRPAKKTRTSRAVLPMQRDRIPTSTPAIPPPRRTQGEFSMPRLPPPKVGQFYSANECVYLLHDLPKNMRRKVIMKWKDGNMIPVHETAVYRRLRQFAQGKPVRAFGKPGRPNLLGEEDLQAMAKVLNEKHGQTATATDVKQAIKEYREKEVRMAGRVPLQSMSPSHGSIIHYKARLSEQEGVSISTSAIRKTNSHITAENSLISAMALVVGVAATHYRLTDEPQTELVDRLTTEGTPGAVKLYEMLLKIYGPEAHLAAVKPCYNLSTDDTVTYIYAGTEEEKEKFMLVGLNSNTGRHSRSHYTPDNSKSHAGMRVKLTYTFSGAGVQAPPFITVSGLTAEELPVETCESGILCLAVEGLTVAGGGVTVGQQGKGFMVFIRNDSDGDKDKKRVRFYRDHVLFPFVSELRKAYDGWEESMPITDDLEVVSWCDGDNAQIQSIIGSIDEYAAHRIVGMKQNAARTGTEQAADLARVFPNMEALHRKVSMEDVPGELHPLKMSVSRAFRNLADSKTLNLPANKRNALIDLVACVPQTMARACTTAGIMHGFKENGMLDTNTKRYPDWDKMLATCRTNPTEEEVAACENGFPRLLQYFLDNGHVPDRVFEEFLNPDVNPNGEIVRRDAEGADAESRQRVKCLTHSNQVQLRAEKIAKVNAEKQRVKADRKKAIVDTLEMNKQCEAKLGEDFKTATFDEFAKATRPLLKSFIQARNPTAKIGSMKKGTPVQAEAGEENLIRLAWVSRETDVVLAIPSEATTTTTETTINDNVPITESATIHNITMGRSSISCEEVAAEILEDEDWVAAIRESLVVEGQELHVVDTNMKEQANVLQKLILARITAHARRRVGNDRSFVFQFVADNAARMAALLCLQGHVKQDVACLGSEKTLLATSTINFASARSENNKTREGCYLYYDTNDGTLIRSGKVSGRSFQTRDDEHAKAAAKGEESLFYRRYPSRLLTGLAVQGRKGVFENLVQLVAVSYDPTNISLDANLDTIVTFSSQACERMEKIKFGNSENVLPMSIKRRHMAAYLFELVYDVSIAIADNVSTSPGFESCGLWKK